MSTIVDTSRFGDDTTFAHTVTGVRQLLRKAKTVHVRVTISRDASVDVRASKSAVLEAIAGFGDTDVVGAMLWGDGDFVLCIGERFIPHPDGEPLTSRNINTLSDALTDADDR